MELINQNTVILNLEEYNKLRDFKTEIEAGKILTCYKDIYYNSSTEFQFYSESEVLVKVAESNNKLNLIITNLQAQIDRLIADKKVEQSNEHKCFIDQVKKMSIWDFIKYRKS